MPQPISPVSLKVSSAIPDAKSDSVSTSSPRSPTVDKPPPPPVVIDVKSTLPPKEASVPPSPVPKDEPPVNAQEPTSSSADVASSEQASSNDDLEVIDMEIFKQILELDEDDTRDFSQGMVWAYFSQVVETFEQMETARANKDLPALSSLGHFLKGSSAALGVSRVQISCERMQHYGSLRDEEADVDLTPDTALAKITSLLALVQEEFKDAEKWLRDWFKEQGIEGDPPE